MIRETRLSPSRLLRYARFSADTAASLTDSDLWVLPEGCEDTDDFAALAYANTAIDVNKKLRQEGINAVLFEESERPLLVRKDASLILSTIVFLAKASEQVALGVLANYVYNRLILIGEGHRKVRFRSYRRKGPSSWEEVTFEGPADAFEVFVKNYPKRR